MRKIASAIIVIFVAVAALAYAGDQAPLVVQNGALRLAGSGDTLAVTSMKLNGITFPASTAAPGFFTYGQYVHNWHPTGLANNAVIYATSNDDMGTTITGIDSAGLTVGDATKEGATVKVCNLAGVQDAFVLTLRNLDTRSSLGNRILTPGAGDGARCSVTNGTTCRIDGDCPGGETCVAFNNAYVIGSNTCATLRLRKAWLARGDSTNYAWVVEDAQTRFAHATTTSLQFYPTLTTDSYSGTIDDFDPTCSGSACDPNNSYPVCSFADGSGTGSARCGIAGSTLKSIDYSLIYVTTASGGATLNGWHYESQEKSIGGIGPYKIIFNVGPGQLTLKNHSAANSLNNIDIGPNSNQNDIVLEPNQSIAIYHRVDSGSWNIASGKADYNFSGRNITVTKGAQFTGVDTTQPVASSWVGDIAVHQAGAYTFPASVNAFYNIGSILDGTFNTTASGGTVNNYGMFVRNAATRSSGANTLFNIAMYLTASGGGANRALWVEGGDVLLDTGSAPVNITGPTSVLNSLQVTGHYRATGTAPTLSSCGTSPSAVTGSDTGGFFTTGSATTSCTLTFAGSFSIEPDCILAPMGTATYPTYTVSATAMTMATVIASTKYHYQCHQLN